MLNKYRHTPTYVVRITLKVCERAEQNEIIKDRSEFFSLNNYYCRHKMYFMI